VDGCGHGLEIYGSGLKYKRCHGSAGRRKCAAQIRWFCGGLGLLGVVSKVCRETNRVGLEDPMGVGQRRVASVAVLVAFLVIAANPLVSPRSAGELSKERMTDHVAAIAARPHPMGSAANERVKDYLVDFLADLDVTVQTQTLEVDDYYSQPGGIVEITNVFARVSGEQSERPVVFVAHYDSVPTTAGANDNAAAVAALLEVARFLSATPPPVDVILLFTDGEEPAPRYGASAAVTHPWLDDPRLVVNLEGIGRSGPSMLVEVSGPTSDLVSVLSGAVPNPVAYSFLTKTTDLIGGASTDFDVFRDRGISGFSFAYLGASSIYHTPRDTIGSLNTGGMLHTAGIVLGLAQHPVRGRSQPTGDAAVFFTIPGSVVVKYGAGVAAFIGVVSAVAVVVVVNARRRTGRLRSWGLLTGFAIGSVWITAFSVVGAVAWSLVASRRQNMGAVEIYAWFSLIVGLGALAWPAVRRWSSRHGADIPTAALVVWGLGALVTGVWLPEMGALFGIPTVAVCLAALWNTKREWGGFVVRGIATLLALVVLLPAAEVFLQLAVPRPGNPDSELLAVIAIPLLLSGTAMALFPNSANTVHPAAERDDRIDSVSAVEDCV
jgi:Peptidase family M28